MKISLKWLSDYVDVGEFFSQPEALEKILTRAGLEVENMENQTERFRGVVVGHIVELGRHPDADRLTLCQVDVGNETKQIICGATNHKQGDKVVVALPGAVLPGDFAIKKSKIRGVESHGMLCSDSELGLSDEADGIRILPEDAPIGDEFSSYQGLDDVVFELSVTPNRSDCLSHFGLARELSCLLDRPCQLPEVKFGSQGGKVSELTSLDLKSPELCPRYAGRGVIGVKVAPSPAWLKTRLEAVGMNSINNIVDITNFVMLELGQPLHAFDADRIGGAKIIIDKSSVGEKFTTLDGTEIELSGHELMIRDADKPVALAGVVGGLNSGVTDATTSIFLESAHFTMDGVRRSSRKFGIDTDSGYRFSRGTDPEGVLTAMDRACQLIQELAGGRVTKDHFDLYPEPLQREAIEIEAEYLEERLGYSVEMKDFDEWMKRLGCVVKAKGTKRIVNTPAYRWDLGMPEDLVEEFARLHGYENIPEVLPPLVDEPTHHAKEYANDNRLVEVLGSEGYLQAVNYNFIGAKYQKDFLFGAGAKGQNTSERHTGLGLNISFEAIPLKNPLSEETGVMRTSLVPGLMKNFVHNYRHGSYFGRLFELGFSFGKKAEEFEQFHHLALVAWGQREGLWAKAGERPVVYDLKANIESVLEKLHCQSFQWRGIREADQLAFLHPGQSAALFLEGRVVGFVGTLHPSIQQEYKVRHDVAVAEFDAAAIMRGQPRVPKAKKISKFPAVERDLAFLVPDELVVGELTREMKKLGGQLLQSVDVFDVYRDKSLPEGQSSIAFRLVFQDLKETLSEEQLTALQKKMIEGLEKKFSISVR